ncbi:hypothetical protein C427_3984 [Paraglaciecola psychrophila 170]|uniref:Uncharacterized protein n=1 Tax=Paraglaciecola psychrophila 170 TaxID=1129794 RepID=M4RV36_9ALTE|nr:hypothetical protein C427_3984 [Paraglaciecola psychrophila 170]
MKSRRKKARVIRAFFEIYLQKHKHSQPVSSGCATTKCCVFECFSLFIVLDISLN